MSIPPRFLDELRNRITLSDIIGRSVKLTRAGREFKGCCPFHNEKTPSFYVNDDKQFYHCFGCGAHGDVISFITDQSNMTFPEAVEMLAAEAGMQVPKQSPQEIQKAKVQKDLYSLMEEATGFFQQHLAQEQEGQVSLNYLRERGMNEDSMARFKVGYAPADGQALRKYLAVRGYSDAQMIEAGVLKASTKGGEPYIFFRERIMFPVTDRRGRVIAFGGRILPDHLRPPQSGDFKPPKYINSSDTPIFNKSEILYGGAHARQGAGDGHTMIVVEGYMDVIACHQAGFRGAVAPMGTSLTQDQILLLWKMIPADEKVPVLCFDGDDAGRRAASRAAQNILPLLEAGRSVKLAFLPDGEDPDSLVRHGGQGALKKVLQNALSLFDFIWNAHTAGRKFETPESRAGVIKALKNEISVIAAKDVQSHYNALLQTRISETFFKRGDRGGKGGNAGGGTGVKVPALKPRKPAYQAAGLYPRILLAAVMNHPHIYAQVEEDFGAFEIPPSRIADLRGAMVQALDEDHDLDFEGLCNHLKEKGFEKEMDDIACESVYVHAAFARPGANRDDTVARWHDFLTAYQSQDLAREIKAGWKQAFLSSSEEEEEKMRHLASSGQPQS